MSLPPRVVVAAPRSGVGKTTVATGLVAAFAARGTSVAAAKVGPDFIDPGYHALASGRAPRNLDAVMHGEDRVAPLLAHAAGDAEVAVVEGVMGLLDGLAGDHDDGRGHRHDVGSTAHVARLLRAPVLLVVDAAATSRSIAAEVHGFATYDPEVRLAGVILNRVGSEHHERLLRDAMRDVEVPVVGALRRHDEVEAPSRHLGLVPAAERDREATAAVAALGALVGGGVDLQAVLGIARGAPALTTEPWDPTVEVGGPRAGGVRPRIAVAGGRAFTFAYTEHRELLEAAGAEVVTLDPLVDEALPEGTDALVLGGGFPETYAGELSDNRPLRDEVAALASGGAPVIAECGGLLYLCESLDDRQMCGVLPARARFTERLTLGYRDATLVGDTALGAAGVRARGHEFHRTVVEPRAGAAAAWRLRRPDTGTAGDVGAADAADLGPEGFAVAGVHASYLHASWVGTPSLAGSLVEGAARAHRRRLGEVSACAAG